MTDELTSALEARGPEAASLRATDPDLPEAVRDRLVDFEAGVARPGDLEAIIEAEMRVASEDLAEEVRAVVRGGIVSSTRRIYAATTVLVLLSLLITLRIPELPLRDRSDAEVAAEAVETEGASPARE